MDMFYFIDTVVKIIGCIDIDIWEGGMKKIFKILDGKKKYIEKGQMEIEGK